METTDLYCCHISRHCAKIAQCASTIAEAALKASKDTSLRDLGLDEGRKKKNQKNKHFKDDLESHLKPLGFLNDRITAIEAVVTVAGFPGEYPKKLCESLQTLSSILTFKDKRLAGELTIKKLIDAYDLSLECIARINFEAIATLNKSLPVTGEIKSSPHPDKLFNILFLSDFHWRGAGESSRWNSVQGSFFDSLKKAHHEVGGIDLIVFGGDLVFSGRKDEFIGKQSVKLFIDQLRKHLNEVGCKAPLLSVPGNHDLVRPGIPELKTKQIEKYLQELHEAMFEKKPNPKKKIVEDAFENYRIWRSAQTKEDVKVGYLDKNQYRTGGLGDFSYRASKGKLKVGIVGLNSTYLQLMAGNLKGYLRMDRKQLDAVLPKDRDEWFRENHVNVLVSHHPVDWLRTATRDHFKNDIFVKEAFLLHLNGHLHAEKWEGVSGTPGKMQYHFQSASLFSDVEFEDEEGTKHKKRKAGYSMLQFNLDSPAIHLRVRPRTFNDSGDECLTDAFPLDGESGWTKWINLKNP